AGGLDGPLVDGLEEVCWDTGAAVQATIQITRTPARRPARCGDIARKDNVPPLFAGPLRNLGGGALLGTSPDPAPRVLIRRLEGRLGGFLSGASRGASGGSYPAP